MGQLYRIRLDGTDIHRVGFPAVTLLEPTLTLEAGAAGSLSFLLPPGHVFYDSVSLLTSTVEVLEDNTPIWSGRPVEMSVDFQRRRRVYCEGALAYLNDSVQGAAEYNSVSIRSFFSTLITAHNAAVPASRRFTVGNVTVTDKTVYRKLSYEGTYDAIRSMCLDTRGGWLVVRRESGTNYLDWLSTLPGNGDQPVQYGYNLLDLNQSVNGGEIVTQVLPLGDNDSNGSPITVASVNSGSLIVTDAALVTQYGAITQTVQFSGVTTPAALLSEAQDWLAAHQPGGATLEVSAADLYYINDAYQPLMLGQKVQVVSAPHGVNRTLPITKLAIKLDSAEKRVTLGTVARKSLTEITKDDQRENRQGKHRSGNGYSGGGSSGGGGGGGGGDGWTHWVGTAAEYAALSSYDAHTIYFVSTGDENGSN